MKKLYSLITAWVILFESYKPAYSAQSSVSQSGQSASGSGYLFILFMIVLVTLLSALYLYGKARKISTVKERRQGDSNTRFKEYLHTLDSRQVNLFLKLRQGKIRRKDFSSRSFCWLLLIAWIIPGCTPVFAQSVTEPGSLLGEGGIIITLILILIPVLAGIILMIIRIRNVLQKYKNEQNQEEASKFAAYLNDAADKDEIDHILLKRKQALDY